MTKKVLIPTTVVAVLALGGVALAFWSGAGTGSGTATVGSGGGITLSATVTAGIFPGGSRPVAITASNPGTSAVMVADVDLDSVTVDAGHSACLTADFTMADVTENYSLVAGASNAPLPTGGTLVFANTAIDQNACKGATLTLALSST
jgi:hypothetical protein